MYEVFLVLFAGLSGASFFAALNAAIEGKKDAIVVFGAMFGVSIMTLFRVGLDLL